MTGSQCLSQQPRVLDGHPPWWVALPSQGHSHPHSLGLGPLRNANSPVVPILGCRRKPESPEKNPCRHGRDMLRGLHRQWPLPESIFSHQHYYEVMLNKHYLRTCYTSISLGSLTIQMLVTEYYIKCLLVVQQKTILSIASSNHRRV